MNRIFTCRISAGTGDQGVRSVLARLARRVGGDDLGYSLSRSRQRRAPSTFPQEGSTALGGERARYALCCVFLEGIHTCMGCFVGTG